MTAHLNNQLEDTQFIEQIFYAAWVARIFFIQTNM